MLATSHTGTKRKLKGLATAAEAIRAGGAIRMALIAQYESIKKPAKANKGPFKVPPLTDQSGGLPKTHKPDERQFAGVHGSLRRTGTVVRNA